MFHLTITCPKCNKIISYCSDSTLLEDKTESNPRPCDECKSPPKSRMLCTVGIGHGKGMFTGKKKNTVNER